MSWHTPGRTWRSGPWSVELRDDELANVAFDERTALRSIRAVVRDRNWDTARLVVDDVATSADSLVLRIHTDGLDARFTGALHVAATPSRLVVQLDLKAEAAFATNRIGLVVLHPPGVAGAALRVRHSNGDEEVTRFPSEINPHQPVLDIAGLAWTSDGLELALTFEGDAFEMEDQRNWTDASFKTYSRPLALPFPYGIEAGEHVRQRVEVQARAVGEPVTGAPDVIELDAGGPFPDIVVGSATAPDPAPAIEPVGRAVLVELDLATLNWRAALDRAAATGLPLDVRFVLSDAEPSAILEGAGALREHDVVRVTAFNPTGDAEHVSDAVAIDALRDALAAAGASASVVGGARSHFTELNRERHRLPAGLEGIVFSITPLFHTRGTEQLVESLAMQRLVAQQAVDYAAGLPVHVGPVTLRPRFNNVATTPPPRPAHADLREGHGPQLVDADDERQDASELAAWTVASAAALAVPGVASIAFFEEWGPRGIRTTAGTDRPVAHAVRALAQLHGHRLLHGSSPDGLVWAIGGVSDAGHESVLVANLDRLERTVDIRTLAQSRVVTVAPGEWTALHPKGEHA
ncbi:hypothetical protein [Humibacter sp.]|uniref:hypothetical protein n=1 Tax=Humibacter sp. TaxID=1940291 RepID=UPI003F80ABA5